MSRGSPRGRGLPRSELLERNFFPRRWHGGRSAKDTNKHRVSGRIRHVLGIIFLLHKNNNLTDTFPIRVLERIRRISVSSMYRTRYVTIF
jgi:hypothetical protein